MSFHRSHLTAAGSALLLLASACTTPVVGQSTIAQSPGPAASVKPVAKRSILFIGNSFTQGAHSAVRNWRANEVSDLNGAGYGGVPALFHRFAKQAGLDYEVSLETQGGKTLGFHYDERRGLFDRKWDVVVLQELSTLSLEKPGDATSYIADVGRLASLFQNRNKDVDIWLYSTWSRADQTYRPTGHWYGKPIGAMATDLRAAADRARQQVPGISGVLPAGEAWNLAFTSGVADADPYDGTAYGQLNLWTYDEYHASVPGYYLSALVIFGGITGIDPTTLGPDEEAAQELGLSAAQATALQHIARQALK